MVYEFECKETGEVIQEDFSMKDDIPQKIEWGGKIFKRVFSNQCIHIPSDWNKPKIDFSKSPSRKKHIY